MPWRKPGQCNFCYVQARAMPGIVKPFAFASCIRWAETNLHPVVNVAVMSCALPIALRSLLAIVLILPLRPPLTLRGGGGCFSHVSLYIHNFSLILPCCIGSRNKRVFAVLLWLVSLSNRMNAEIYAEITFGLTRDVVLLVGVLLNLYHCQLPQCHLELIS